MNAAAQDIAAKDLGEVLASGNKAGTRTTVAMMWHAINTANGQLGPVLRKLLPSANYGALLRHRDPHWTSRRVLMNAEIPRMTEVGTFCVVSG